MKSPRLTHYKAVTARKPVSGCVQARALRVPGRPGFSIVLQPPRHRGVIGGRYPARRKPHKEGVMLIRTPEPHRTLEKMRRRREWRRHRRRARQRPAAARNLLDGLSAVAVSILGLRRYLESPFLARGDTAAVASFGD